MTIEYKKEGRVAIFTINSPNGTNLLNREGLRELSSAMIDFRDDPDLWVGIITGGGRRVFCAGLDLTDMPPQTKPQSFEPVPPLPQRGLDIWKPLIAAINGLAIGGGSEITLACDIRITSNNARLGLPEVTLGLIPGWGGTQRLARQIPWCKAAEMILTGKLIDAEEAYRINLVNEIVSIDNLIPTARNYAALICQASPVAVRAAKEAMLRGYGMALEDGLKLENDLLSLVLQTEDCSEGIKAFRERRKPVYQGY